MVVSRDRIYIFEDVAGNSLAQSDETFSSSTNFNSVSAFMIPAERRNLSHSYGNNNSYVYVSEVFDCLIWLSSDLLDYEIEERCYQALKNNIWAAIQNIPPETYE